MRGRDDLSPKLEKVGNIGERQHALARLKGMSESSQTALEAFSVFSPILSCKLVSIVEICYQSTCIPCFPLHYCTVVIREYPSSEKYLCTLPVDWVVDD